MHQPGLDGLRGLAVAAVVAFHLGFGGVSGGYLGVSLFFTLSGVLIGSLVLNEITTSGRFSLRSFWMRRARRLLPPALITLVVVAIGRLVTANLNATSGSDVVASALNVANWHFLAGGSSYADCSAGRRPCCTSGAWSAADGLVVGRRHHRSPAADRAGGHHRDALADEVARTDQLRRLPHPLAGDRRCQSGLDGSVTVSVGDARRHLARARPAQLGVRRATGPAPADQFRPSGSGRGRGTGVDRGGVRVRGSHNRVGSLPRGPVGTGHPTRPTGESGGG